MKIVYIISRKINNAEAYYNGYSWTDLKTGAHEYTTFILAETKLKEILKNPKESNVYYEIQTCYRR